MDATANPGLTPAAQAAGATARPPDGPSPAFWISLGGAAALAVVGAGWLWIARGEAILLDIERVFCF